MARKYCIRKYALSNTGCLRKIREPPPNGRKTAIYTLYLKYYSNLKKFSIILKRKTYGKRIKREII